MQHPQKTPAPKGERKRQRTVEQMTKDIGECPADAMKAVFDKVRGDYPVQYSLIKSLFQPPQRG